MHPPHGSVSNSSLHSLFAIECGRVSHTSKSNVTRPSVKSHRHARRYPVARTVPCVAQKRTSTHDLFRNLRLKGIKGFGWTSWIARVLVAFHRGVCAGCIPICTQLPNVASQVPKPQSIGSIGHHRGTSNMTIFGVVDGWENTLPDVALDLPNIRGDIAPRKPHSFST